MSSGNIPRNSQQQTDSELVDRVRNAPEGNFQASEILVERYRHRVLSDCRNLSGSHPAAEDLAQEVFVKAFRGASRFEGRSSFSSWLYRIKVNHCRSFLKQQERAQFVGLDDSDFKDSLDSSAWQVASGAERVHLRADISKVLDRMPETLRVPPLLRDVNGLSYDEISRTLGISLSATKMRIKRGREQFRRRFREFDPTSAP